MTDEINIHTIETHCFRVLCSNLAGAISRGEALISVSAYPHHHCYKITAAGHTVYLDAATTSDHEGNALFPALFLTDPEEGGERLAVRTQQTAELVRLICSKEHREFLAKADEVSTALYATHVNRIDDEKNLQREATDKAKEAFKTAFKADLVD